MLSSPRGMNLTWHLTLALRITVPPLIDIVFVIIEITERKRYRALHPLCREITAPQKGVAIPTIEYRAIRVKFKVVLLLVGVEGNVSEIELCKGMGPSQKAGVRGLPWKDGLVALRENLLNSTIWMPVKNDSRVTDDPKKPTVLPLPRRVQDAL